MRYRVPENWLPCRSWFGTSQTVATRDDLALGQLATSDHSIARRSARRSTRLVPSIVAGAALALSSPSLSQTSAVGTSASSDKCSGVMERLNEARTNARRQYIQLLMSSEGKCMGESERLDKARMITRDEYVATFKRKPDCSVSAYSYMCE